MEEQHRNLIELGIDFCINFGIPFFIGIAIGLIIK